MALLVAIAPHAQAQKPAYMGGPVGNDNSNQVICYAYYALPCAFSMVQDAVQYLKGALIVAATQSEVDQILAEVNRGTFNDNYGFWPDVLDANGTYVASGRQAARILSTDWYGASIIGSRLVGSTFEYVAENDTFTKQTGLWARAIAAAGDGRYFDFVGYDGQSFPPGSPFESSRGVVPNFWSPRVAYIESVNTSSTPTPTTLYIVSAYSDEPYSAPLALSWCDVDYDNLCAAQVARRVLGRLTSAILRANTESDLEREFAEVVKRTYTEQRLLDTVTGVYNTGFYPFIYAFDGTCVAHAHTPSLVGRTLPDIVDGKNVSLNGTALHESFKDAATIGSGAVGYDWRNSLDGDFFLKIGFITGVTKFGSDYYIGVGFTFKQAPDAEGPHCHMCAAYYPYTMPCTFSNAEHLIGHAQSLFFMPNLYSVDDIFASLTSNFRATGLDSLQGEAAYGYVFVYDYNGTCVAHGAHPEYVGTDVSSHNSAVGAQMHNAFIAAADSGGGWFVTVDDDGGGEQFVYVTRVDAGAGSCTNYNYTYGCYYLATTVEDRPYTSRLAQLEQTQGKCPASHTQPCAEDWIHAIVAAVEGGLIRGFDTYAPLRRWLDQINATQSNFLTVVFNDTHVIYSSEAHHMSGPTDMESFIAATLFDTPDTTEELAADLGVWTQQYIRLNETDELTWFNIFHHAIQRSSILAFDNDATGQDVTDYYQIYVGVPKEVRPLPSVIGGSCAHVDCYRNGAALASGGGCAVVTKDGGACECDGQHDVAFVVAPYNSSCPATCTALSCTYQARFQVGYTMQCHYIEPPVVRLDIILSVSLTVAALLALCCGAAFLNSRRKRRRGRLLLRDTNLPPTLSLHSKMRYHLFLSHVWRSGQDQVSVIKRALNSVMIDPKIFLDVDDLESIDDLEEYIAQSQVVLLFLSKGYFLSRNCLREVRAAAHFDKRLVLVHESDMSKGGIELDELRSECPPELHAYVFGEPGKSPNEIIAWRRVKDFQDVSITRIAEHLTRASPGYAAASTRKSARNLELYFPRGITEHMPPLPHVRILVSKQNGPRDGGYGAYAVAMMLRAHVRALHANQHLKGAAAAALPEMYGTDTDGSATGTGTSAVKQKLRTLYTRQDHFVVSSNINSLFAMEADGGAIASVASSSHDLEREDRSNAPTHMLVYLNKHMFNGADGTELARQLRHALSVNLPLILIHETVPSRNGCEFDRFFYATPEDLLDNGIFSSLATPMYEAERENEVCFAMIYRSLAASAASSHAPTGHAPSKRLQFAKDMKMMASNHGLVASEESRRRLKRSPTAVSLVAKSPRRPVSPRRSGSMEKMGHNSVHQDDVAIPIPATLPSETESRDWGGNCVVS